VRVVLRSLFCLLFGTATCPLAYAGTAQAQPKVERSAPRHGACAPRKRKPKKRPRPKVAQKPQKRVRPKPRAVAKPPRAPSPSAAQTAQEAASGVDSEIVKEGETTVKMMKFSGLGIEGRLKSPQLVYFVQRVHAEFERPTLPHRSFMPELDATTQREPLR
jgi:hypothetical protein